VRARRSGRRFERRSRRGRQACPGGQPRGAHAAHMRLGCSTSRRRDSVSAKSCSST